jgi:hypothetical protein
MAVEVMLDKDRTFFEQHPEATEYWRELMPGDLFISSLDSVFSGDGKPMKVRVKLVGDGIRARVYPPNMCFVVGSLNSEYIMEIMLQLTELPESWADGLGL